MTLARAALLAAPLVLVCRTGVAEPCAPRAALAGDRDAIAHVAAELARLGVITDTTRRDARCPGVAATLEARDGGIAIVVHGETRVVSDAALAAAWIDSWLLDDTIAPVSPPLAPPALAPRIETRTAPAPSRSWLDRASLAVDYESSHTTDGAWWNGVGGAACVRVGAFCLGARARYATLGAPMLSRDDVSALATASWSRDLGRLTVAPELGVGGGLMSTGLAKCPPPPCDPTMGPCPSCPSTSTSAPSLRVSAALRVAVPLAEHVWLDGAASYVVAAEQTRVYNGLPPPPPQDPWGTLYLAIGLRVGAP